MDNNTPTTSSNKKPIDKIFSLLKENKIDEAYSYVKSGELREVETTDEHGTTPLQYASFRGLLDMCKLLVSRGADVNAKTHDQGYTALMFAAISNHTHVVRYLLELGADIDYTNTIGRTAAQMATFVNSNEAADLINSYISKSDFEYYTKVNSIDEKEPKLPKGECCNELHKLLTTSAVNYSPVRIMKAIKLASNNVLMVNLDRVIRTLDAFSRKAFRDEMNECPNDILSFKLHYYKYIFEYLSLQKKKLIEKQISEGKKQSEQEIEEKVFDLCIRQLLTEEQVQVNIDGETKTKSYRVFEEKFVRESIRQYPYKECALLRQMVTILARVTIGSQPSALYVIKSCMHGQKFNEQFGNDDDDESSKKEEKRKLLECVTCSSKSYDAKWCTHCKKVAYCDQFCQRLHWPIHKKQTAELAT